MREPVYISWHRLWGDPLIGGRTEGERLEHLHARGAFVDELGQHERTRALLERWAADGDIADALERAVRSLDAAAQARGYDNRADLAPILRESREALALLGREALEPVAEYQMRLEGVLQDPTWAARMREDSMSLARSFELDWPWIALECVSLFESRLSRRLLNLPTLRVRYAPTTPYEPAPDVQLSFTTTPGESSGELSQRFDRWAQQKREQLAAFVPDPLPPGIRPIKRADTYETWGRWFGRNRLHGVSVRRLALDEYDDEDRRADVRRGIRRAEEVLSRRPWYPDDPVEAEAR